VSNLLPVPAGDPAGLRAVAGQLGRVASDHAAQLAAFKSHVRTALDGWTGPIAEQYAVAAGHTCGRFTVVSTQLKTAQSALSAYAGALESAQATIAQVNRDIAAQGGTPSWATLMRGVTAATDLNRAADACARTLSDAEATLGAGCPDTLTAQQLVSVVHRAASRITSPATLANFERLLADWALYANAAGAIHGSLAGVALRESRAVAEALTKEKLLGQAARLLANSPNKDSLLKAWENLAHQAEKDQKVAEGTVKEVGGSWWEGLLKSNKIEIETKGAHAAEQTFVDELLRTSKFDLALAPITIAFGIHDIIWPGDGPSWEQWGNRVAGGASALGGAAVATEWAAGLFGVTWEIPGVDVVTGVLLGGAALWTAGTWVYDERHNIAVWFDRSMHDADNWYHDVVNFPNQFWSGLKNAFDPLAW
jgi:uncharacterized protein YukE